MNGEVNLTVKTPTLEFSLKFDRNVSVIRGDSGTGKTYLCDLVRQARSGDRGVVMTCDRNINIRVMPEDTLTDEFSTPWYTIFKQSHDTLFIIDENCDCLKGRPINLSNGIRNTSNYYVIISRELFSDIPYSVYSIYELKVDQSVTYDRLLIHNQRIYSN